MPRGKRTVFAVNCSESGDRIGTLRMFKQDKKGVAWKDHVKDMKKFCPACRKRVAVKCKEERHSK